jgi:hypothetical protein
MRSHLILVCPSRIPSMTLNRQHLDPDLPGGRAEDPEAVLDADISVFDASAVRDRATVEDSTLPSGRIG